MIPGGDIGGVLGNSNLAGAIGAAGSSGVVSAVGAQYDSAFQAFESCAKFVFDFIKLDIFMNFFQQIGLWFTKFKFPEAFEKMFHKFMDFVSLVWQFVLGITELQIFYVWAIVSMVMFICWLIQKQTDPEAEVKGPNAFGWEKRGAIWNLWVYGLVTGLTLLYLPSITSGFKVIFCFEGLMFPYELTCYHGKHWIHFSVAMVHFVFIGLFLPFQVYLTINKYQPKPQKYDASGEVFNLAYDKDKYLEQYKELVAADKCPYNFLYAGYEYGWSAYKVITMVIKMLLIIPLIPLFVAALAPACVSLVIVFIYALCSIISSPFILPQDDWIDLSARITAVLTISIQICVIEKVINPPYDSLVLSFINILNLTVMVLIFVAHLNFVRVFFRKRFGKLKFSPGMAYNPPIERQRRIWHRFWRGLFASCGTLEPCAERLNVMENIFRTYGKIAYKQSLIPPNQDIAQARRMCLEIEGPDCYFRTSRRQGKTNWGRMFITPFPFKINMIYDDNTMLELLDDEVLEFYRQNFFEQNVTQGRKVRMFLRCLNGESVNFQLQTIVPRKEGGPKEEVPVNFSRGVLRVKAIANDPFANGFKVKIHYTDGTCTLSSGRCVENIEFKAKNHLIGITDSYTLNAELQRLFNDPDNKRIIEAKWDSLVERIKLMHDDLEESRREDEEILSYNFWQLVYMNDHVPEDELIAYLRGFEQNNNVHDITTLYKQDLDGIYSRLKYYDCHPAVATWYCFFDDIALYNHMLKPIADNPDLFDMANSTALAYHPCTIDELKRKLEERGLRTSRGRGLFTNAILADLEEKLKQDCQDNYQPPDPSKIPYVSPMSQALLADTRCSSTPILTENTSYIATAFMCCI